MKNNLISIVIPTFNRTQQLVDAITSVTEQDYRPLEIVIGDDSTDDCTKNAIQVLTTPDGTSVKYFHNTPSLGQAANVNRLFQEASGDLFILLHDDDLLLPGAISALATAYNDHPSVTAVYGLQRIMDNLGNDLGDEAAQRLNHTYLRTPDQYGLQIESLAAAIRRQFPNNGFLIDAKLAKEIGYPQDAGSACDSVFGVHFARASEDRHFFLLDKFTAVYRLSGFSVSNSDASAASDFWRYLISINCSTAATTNSKNTTLSLLAPIVAGQLVRERKCRDAFRIWMSSFYGIKRFGLRGIYCLATIICPYLKRNAN